jgi:hypothetical protein
MARGEGGKQRWRGREGGRFDRVERERGREGTREGGRGKGKKGWSQTLHRKQLFSVSLLGTGRSLMYLEASRKGEEERKREEREEGA